MTTNRQIYIENTDTIDSLGYTPLSPKYIKVSITGIAAGYIAVMVLLPIILLSDFEYRDIAVPAGEITLAIALIMNLLMARAICRFKGYALREHDITYRSGIIFPKTTTMPFNKIQQVSIRQGLISRIFGLYTVEILNGSQKAMSQISIPGLSKQEAENLKATLLQKSEYAGN